jgi:phosphatidylglycerophosphate synthase
MRTARNIAIIALLALIVAVAPGGGNAADGILALISLTFCVLVGAAGYQLYRQHRLTYLGLAERQRAMFIGSLGAIVLMIAGASDLTSTGAGLLVWLAVIAFSVITMIKVWGDARAY